MKTAYQTVRETVVDEMDYVLEHRGLRAPPILVKRFKRQFCLSMESKNATPAVSFNDLPFFRWTTDIRANIGEPLLRDVRSCLLEHKEKLTNNMIAYRDTTERLRADFDRSWEIDADLSIAVHNLMITKHDEASEQNFWDAGCDYLDGVDGAIEFIEQFYFDPSVLTNLIKKHPVPPPQLTFQSYAHLQRLRMRLGGDFLTWMIRQKNAFQLDRDTEYGIAQIIVDVNAVSKQEVPPSTVVFPQEAGIFPDDRIYDLVDTQELDIDPAYALKFPSSENDSDKLAPPGPRFKPMKKPATSAMRPPKQWPENPESPFPPTDTPDKNRMVSFASPLAKFEHPANIPMYHRSPKFNSANPNLKSVMRKPKEFPENPASPAYVATPDKVRSLAFNSPLAKMKEVSRYSPAPKAKSARLAPESEVRKTRILEDDKYALSVYDQKYGQLLDDMKREIRQESGALPVRSPEPGPSMRSSDNDISACPILDEPPSEEPTRQKKKLELDTRTKMLLFLDDMEMTDDGRVIHKTDGLGIEFDLRLKIATDKETDLALTEQIISELHHDQERKRQEYQKKVDDLFRNEKRKRDEERQRQEAERARQEQLELQEKQREEEKARQAKRDQELAVKGLRAAKHTMIEPLSHHWDSAVDAVSHKSPTAELAKTLDGTALTKRDFGMLVPEKEWLNDNVIIGAVLAVAEYVNTQADAPKEKPKCVAFNSYFYPRLDEKGPDATKRMTRGKHITEDNFFDIDSILIPICAGSHWTLALVRPSLRLVTHMDSMRAGAGLKAVRETVMGWVKMVLGTKFVAEEWKDVEYSCPRQRNGWDCGVFLITNATCVGLGLDPDTCYEAGQLTLQRRRIAAMLLNGGFKGDFSLDDLVES